MGASGRPEYECHTPETAIDFHLDSIKAWMDRQQIDVKGNKYYLLGHSLGGYIAC
jgi:alpha-beta hydrolase superfamily lysophospholipase